MNTPFALMLLVALFGPVESAATAPADGAVLLEELTPGNHLARFPTSARDDKATDIIAGIIERMSSVRASVQTSIAVRDLVSGFHRHRHTCDGLMPDAMIQKASGCSGNYARCPVRCPARLGRDRLMGTARRPTEKGAGIDMRLPFITAAKAMLPLVDN